MATYNVTIEETAAIADSSLSNQTWAVAVAESTTAADAYYALDPLPEPEAAAASLYSTVQQVILSYLYQQYSDDDDLQAFVAAYNEYTQAFLDWFNGINLPVYTYGTISGTLLDWVGAGLYGYPRPGLPTPGEPAVGPFNTYTPNSLAFNQQLPEVTQAFYTTTDDIYRRCLTWQFWKGDGRQFNIRWLKRRVARFLTGLDGGPGTVDQTYDISVEFTGPAAVTITVPSGTDAAILEAAIAGGALELPFQYTWTVTT